MNSRPQLAPIDKASKVPAKRRYCIHVPTPPVDDKLPTIWFMNGLPVQLCADCRKAFAEDMDKKMKASAPKEPTEEKTT
jgi:hypothetical protein